MAVEDAPQVENEELRQELQRILNLLGRRLALQGEAQADPSTDIFRGVAIDRSEVESAFDELTNDWAGIPPAAMDQAPGFVPTVPPARGSESPLQRARRVFRLSNLEWDALMLSLAVELDHRFARLVAYLNDHVARTRPTIGLALSLHETHLNAIDFCQLHAIRLGLLQTEGDGPASGLALRIVPEFLPRLGALAPRDVLPAGVRTRLGESPGLQELILSSSRQAGIKHWAQRLRDGSCPPPLILVGPPGAGRATAAQAASAEAGLLLIETDWKAERNERAELLGVAMREALWRDATLLVRVPDDNKDPEFAVLWATLSIYDGPVAVTLSPALHEQACAAGPASVLSVCLEEPSIEEREALWNQLLDGRSGLRATISHAERIELAARFDFVPGLLARAVRRAAAERNGDERPLDFESLASACRAVGSAAMGPIAQRLQQPYTRADLVLPQELMDELDLAGAWMRNRRRVFEDWGFGRRIVLGRGLTALFTGEPGTGKTMATQVLGRELGLDVFRVDLSRVMSKYIGETEKNLSRLFDDARASGAILFFDEADALFGKRTETRDAHDRYANLEIGYLLQRMEEHTGTTVLATNRIGDLDEAFTRRFHFILDFPMPRPPERLRIWQGMLPADAECEDGLDLEVLANGYEISGGEIRNSVLSAAFLAANEGKPIGMRHLKRGLRRELLKTGRVLDSRQRKDLEGV
jgi:DNA polymerase III delta prime subunit